MIWKVTFANRLIVSYLLLILLLTVAPSNGQDAPKIQATPSAVARESFEALKRHDIATYVSLFHPAEPKRFKTFVVNVFKYDWVEDEFRKLFAPYNSTEGVIAASESDLLAAFLKNMFASIPELSEIMADAKLEILGEIVESPDKVHVVSRTVLPRPEPVSFQKYEGRWCLLLNEQMTRVITQFEQVDHFRKKNMSTEDVLLKALKVKMDIIDVIGYAKDGNDMAQVLCRVNIKFGDFGYSVLKCYPVPNSEPAWNYLNDKDKTKLVEALRSKWGL